LDGKKSDIEVSTMRGSTLRNAHSRCFLLGQAAAPDFMVLRFKPNFVQSSRQLTHLSHTLVIAVTEQPVSA